MSGKIIQKYCSWKKEKIASSLHCIAWKYFLLRTKEQSTNAYNNCASQICIACDTTFSAFHIAKLCVLFYTVGIIYVLHIGVCVYTYTLGKVYAMLYIYVTYY